MPDDDFTDDRPRKKRRPAGPRRRPKPDDRLTPWQRVFLVAVGLIACGVLVVEKINQANGNGDRSGLLTGKLFVLVAAFAVLMVLWGIVGRKFGLAEMPDKRR